MPNRCSFPHVAVVLVEPSLPENVGAVARAMDNMGVDTLRLVNPCDHRGAAARTVATHAARILDAAQVFDTLAAAVQDRQVILATSARQRDQRVAITPLTELGRLIPSTARRLAVVFGRERSGLSNAELALCNGCLSIPTFGQSRSLNLSHAVVVTLYELARTREAHPAAPTGSTTPPANSADVEALKAQLFAVLERTRFLRAPNRDSLWQSFSDLLGRARPTSLDVRLWHGVFHRILVTLDRAGTQENQTDAGTSPRPD